MSAIALLSLLSCAQDAPPVAVPAPTSARVAAPALPPLQARPGDRLARAAEGPALDDAREALAAIPGLSPRAAARMVEQQRLALSGGEVVRFRAEVDGVPVLESDVRLLLDDQGHLRAASWGAAVASGLDPAVKASSVVLDGADAVSVALLDRSGADLLPSPVETRGAWTRYAPAVAGDVALSRARSRPVLVQAARGLAHAWLVELWTGPADSTDSTAWELVVAADDGTVLRRRSLTVHADVDYRVWADADLRPLDGPLTDVSPHPTGEPDGMDLEPTDSSLVTVDGLNTNPDGEADPWLPDDATESTGNNADAYTDHYNPDGFSEGDTRAATSDDAAFDWTYDLTLDPLEDDEQIAASITQAFYTVNWLHDWYYDVGFTEALGNAQTDNYGRGGEEADALLIELQDNAPGGSRNNANMSTPGDGSAPRMQVYLWSGTSALSLHIEPGDWEPSTNTASFGPTDFDVTAEVVLPGSDSTACTGVDADVADTIVLIERGDCYFADKVLAAQTAGAVGVIIANNTSGGAMSMGGTDSRVTIPVLSMSQTDGQTLEEMITSDSTEAPPTANLYRYAGPEGDGSLDATVVAHEWGHYLFGRLVGCGSTQCSGINEGHADFVALAMMVREDDDLDGAYAVGSYATWGTSTDPAYFGIRRVPYSADPDKNALSFRHISNGEPLPDTHPLDDDGVYNAEVHNAGEIWATVMHDAQVAILDARDEDGRSFEEAQQRVSEILVAGLALAPNDPTFTELRDAMLAAAALDSSDDALRMAQAFAGRGMGTCAQSPDRYSTDLTGVVESETLAPLLSISQPELADSTLSCDDDGILDGGEVGVLRVTVTNMGAEVLSGTVLQARFEELPADLELVDESVLVDDLDPFTSTVVELPVSMPREAVTQSQTTLTVTATNDDACVTEDVALSWVRTETDIVSGATSTETFEADDDGWTVEGDDGGDIWRREDGEAGDRSWVGEDVSGVTDSRLISPALEVSEDEALVYTLTHRFAFEHDGSTAWDGGVIELSVDDGEWTDISDWVEPGYTDVLETRADNPLGDRRAFSGSNAAWPEYEDLVLDLGDALAGHSVRFSLRVGTDQAASEYGWELDTLVVDGLSADPFAAVVADTTDCNPVPVAIAGDDQTVTEGDEVLLDGSASYDPAGEELAFSWTVLSGEAALVDADGATPSFVAPDVDGDQVIELELTVDDGWASATDIVAITVLDVPAPDDTGPTDDGGSDSGPTGDDGGDDGDGGTDGDVSSDDGGSDKGGCSAAPAAAGGLWIIGLLGVWRRRR
ncbi:MAG: M36 family metallopeptidase [Alphaproteobacteria bacterium]|nr:M36 family metallopeptidase [Alphaproteobacteria bacterium]